MAKFIKCPACGENNLSDQEFCQYCQTRLQPLTGNLKGADAPLTAGQIPTKKDTGELEPILPQWLREARSSARQTSEQNPTKATQPPQAPPRPAPTGGSDLLAGLHSQTQDNEEEDTPDWLANITGETPKTKKSQAESADVRWVELGDANDYAQSDPAPDTPPWLTGLSPLTPQTGEKDELSDWFRDASASAEPQQPSQPISFDSPPSAPSAPESQDWLHSMVADGGAFDDSAGAVDEPLISSDTPDWLRAMAAENDAQKNNAPLNNSSMPPVSSDTPDWLRAMAVENDSQNVNVPPINADTPPVSSDMPDWLSAMAEQDTPQSADSAVFSETGLGESDAAVPSAGDVPDWLKGFESNTSSSDQDWLKGLPFGESEHPAQDSAPAWLSAEQEQPPAVPADVPSWLKSAAPVSTPAQEQLPITPEKNDDALDIPSWLKAAAPQSSIFDEPAVEQETPAPASSSSATSDWLNAFKSVDTPDAPQAVPAFSMEAPVDSAPPAFTDNAQPGAKEDALFTDMPAWLSVADDSVPPESIPAPITNADAIAPGDLPSWVQAMRPVDAGISQSSSTSLSSDKKLESGGALSGLQGVLPAVKGFAPTSKPKAYSIRIQATEEQQAHAALLEQILAAETEPVPIGSSFSVMRTSRGLRWLLAFLFFVGLTAVLFMRTQIFSMPVGVPIEVESALNVVKSIPENAPVLVAVDYEPARVAEMEAVAAPMFDQMHNPRLTFISTNETGAILAERLISGPLAGHNYQSGVQYLNLGYLPGGQMGIRAFAENPSATAPYAYAQSSNLLNIMPTSAWTLPPLEGVASLSQFAALIVITDNADSARTWIEQTTPARGTIPFVMISSAQSAPMIQPYYASQQINGLVSGLYGGALAEQKPGTARTYWDAYSIGMLLAMALILGGGLLNLALGLRDRAAAREAK